MTSPAPVSPAPPHPGYSVHETFESFYRQTVENLDAWLDGRPGRLLETM